MRGCDNTKMLVIIQFPPPSLPLKPPFLGSYSSVRETEIFRMLPRVSVVDLVKL